jgi:hypothetical protein
LRSNRGYIDEKRCRRHHKNLDLSKGERLQEDDNEADHEPSLHVEGVVHNTQVVMFHVVIKHTDPSGFCWKGVEIL